MAPIIGKLSLMAQRKTLTEKQLEVLRWIERGCPVTLPLRPPKMPRMPGRRDTARAMSQENVELAKKGYAAFNELGAEGILELLDPNVEWRTTADQPDPAVYHGHEGVREVISGQLEAFESFQIDIEDVIDAGDFVVVEARIRVRGRGSGVEAEIREAHVHEIRDGKSVRVQEYRTKQEALEAAGLSE